MQATRLKDIMTHSPACCAPTTPLREVAQRMVDNDCGCLPVIDDEDSHRLIGVITDRDITCRAVAKGLDPSRLTAADCMSTPCVTLRADASIEECCQLLEENQIRRIPVVDDDGCCCGIVAQADLAEKTGGETIAEVVRCVSRHTDAPSQVHFNAPS